MSNFDRKRSAEYNLNSLPVRKKHRSESLEPVSSVSREDRSVTSGLLSAPLLDSHTHSDTSPSRDLSLSSPSALPQSHTSSHGIPLETIPSARSDSNQSHNFGARQKSRVKEVLSPPILKRSHRIRNIKLAAIDALKSTTQKITGEASTALPNDVTRLLLSPLEPGADGRGYVSSQVRREINEQVDESLFFAETLEELNLPSPALNLREKAQKSGKLTLSNSSRSDIDGFRSGSDYTYTENYGLSHPRRSHSDTPAPRSPDPFSTGEELIPETRYEKTHKGAYRFSGEPGGTVHAPTQANQVVDTNLERFIAQQPGSFIFRQDTYFTSSLRAVRPSGKGFESKAVSYYRRAVKEPEKDKEEGP